MKGRDAVERQRLEIDKKKPVSRVSREVQKTREVVKTREVQKKTWKSRRRGKSRTTYLAVDSSSIRRGLVENFAVDSGDPADGGCACR